MANVDGIAGEQLLNYIQRIERHLSETPSALRPAIKAAALGHHAGIIGAADLAVSTAHQDMAG